MNVYKEDPDPLPSQHSERSWVDPMWGQHDENYDGLIGLYIERQSSSDQENDKECRRQFQLQREEAERKYNDPNQLQPVPEPDTAKRGLRRVLANLRR